MIRPAEICSKIWDIGKGLLGGEILQVLHGRILTDGEWK
jgi:hypothetical protein